MNLIQLEWGNLGINLWQIEEITWDANGDSTGTEYLTASTSSYDLAPNITDLLGMMIRREDGLSTQTDHYLTPIGRDDYQRITNKNATGLPIQYWLNKIEIKNYTSSDRRSQVYLWPVPDVSSTYKLVYWVMRRMWDAGDTASSHAPIPDRFLPAYITTLASKIAMKSSDPAVMQRYPILKAEAEKLFKEARENDRDRSSFFTKPKIGRF